MTLPAPTPRLRLREWLDKDLDAFAVLNADRRVMAHFPAPLSPAESAAFLEHIRTEYTVEGYGLYALERHGETTPIGYTGLHRVGFAGELHGRIEIGWRLRAEAWGCGYATEAARACLVHAATIGTGEIVSFTATGNLRSQRVMQRMGMEYVGAFDHPALPAGHPLRRHVLYRIRPRDIVPGC